MHPHATRPLAVLVCLLSSASCSLPSADRAEPPGSSDHAVGATPFDRALAFVAAHPDECLADAETRFEHRGTIVEAGREHVRLTRRYKDLRVIGGDVVVHLGDAIEPSMTLARPPSLDITPSINERRARHVAASALGWDGDAADAVELVVYARGNESELAFEITRRADASRAAREDHAFVSARDARMLDQWDAVASVTGEGNGYYSGLVALETRKKTGGYALDDTSRGGLATVDAMGGHGSYDKLVASSNGSFGNGKLSNRASIAADAHYAMAQAWDYFAAVHGRHGVDGAGSAIVARVHYGSGLANAFFDPSCGCINLGDGSPDARGGPILPLASLDVVAHELTHAVTAASAGLYYSGEAGGLNEATSDIFGSMVERHAGNPNDPPDYLIGERVRPPKGLRSMAYPEKDGVSAGCWSPAVRSLDVHWSAGVANHFFYLVAEGTGSQTHSCGVKATIQGLGPGAAAAIWYRALTVYLTADATFASARLATIQAASDLHGVSSPQVSVVKTAWKAVAVP